MSESTGIEFKIFLNSHENFLPWWTHVFMIKEGKLANSDWKKNLWKMIHRPCFCSVSYFSKLIVQFHKLLYSSKHYHMLKVTHWGSDSCKTVNKLDLSPGRFFFLTSVLEYNCFTMVCYFLLYNKVNQLYIYIYPHISSLLRLPPTLPISPL